MARRVWRPIVVSLGGLALAITVTACAFRPRSASPAYVEPDPVACAPFPRATAAEVGQLQPALDSLQRAAVAMRSDALVVVRDGKLVHEWTAPGFRMPFNPQSVTKAIAGLGVGVLLDRGALTSLDLPLHTLFPEFDTPEKRPVTLRMLMNHTSGVAADRGEAQFRGHDDIGAFARGQPMAEPAGTAFRYNNVGAQLVSHVVQARTGAPLHALLDSTVLGPLCIRDWRWETDARGATFAYSRIHLRALDLARIGQLVLDSGAWRGRRILGAATVDTLTGISGGPVAGLASAVYVGLWQYWGSDSLTLDSDLLARLRAVPVSDTLLGLVTTLAGPSTPRRLATHELQIALDSAFGPGRGTSRWYRETGGAVFPRRTRAPAKVVGHSGSWGQYLLVYPETRTVVVRLASWDHPGRTSEDDGFGWSSLVGDAYRLVGRRPAP